MLGAALLGPAPARAGSAVADDSSARTAFTSQVDGLFGQIQVATATATAANPSQATGTALWYDPKASGTAISGAAGYSATDMAWAQSASLINQILQSLGGGTASQREVFQRQGDRYYAGLEGLGGQWFSSAADSEGALLRQLLSQSQTVPDAVKQAVAGNASNNIGVVVQTAVDAFAKTTTFVTQGGSTTVTLTSRAFASTEVPVLYAGRGVSASDIAHGAGDTVTATLTARPDAVAGTSTLLSFHPDSSYLSTDNFPLFVVAVPQSTSAPAPVVPTYADATPLDGSADGVLQNPGDQALYQVNVAAAGQITLATSGPTDVTLSLEKGDGTVLATDDDSGAWYNAKLAATVAPGTYYVRVAHCCDGTGSFTLTSSFAAN